MPVNVTIRQGAACALEVLMRTTDAISSADTVNAAYIMKHAPRSVGSRFCTSAYALGVMRMSASKPPHPDLLLRPSDATP